MNKLILIAGILLIRFSASAKEGQINRMVLASFNKYFTTATSISWSVEKELNKATFTFNNQVTFAYYDNSGELVAIIRNILSDQLPVSLLADLKTNFSDYWICRLFELDSKGQISYYLTLQNADGIITLESNGGKWRSYVKPETK